MTNGQGEMTLPLSDLLFELHRPDGRSNMSYFRGIQIIYIYAHSQKERGFCTTQSFFLFDGE